MAYKKSNTGRGAARSNDNSRTFDNRDLRSDDSRGASKFKPKRPRVEKAPADEGASIRKYVKKDSPSAKSYGNKPSGSSRKPYGQSKPWADKDYSEKRPYADKKFFKKVEGNNETGTEGKKFFKKDNDTGFQGGRSSKPWGDKDAGGERKPYGDKKFFKKDSAGGYESSRTSKPYGHSKPWEDKGSSERKPYGEKKVFRKDGGSERNRTSKPWGDKDAGGDRKPFGEKKIFKNDSAEGFEKRKYSKDFDKSKPMGDRDAGAGRKPFGDKKKFDDRPKRDSSKPFIAKTDEDDSNRFIRAAERFETKTAEAREKAISAYKNKPGKNFRKKHETAAQPEVIKMDDGTMRLNRFIASSGICSRREADEYIKAGLVSVNGVTANEMGSKVDPTKDVVKYNGAVIRNERFRYVLLNKPKDYITTTDDPQQRHTVMELIAKACRERVYPVGRLDRNTTGLLLFTNDGDLADKLMHPRTEVSKIYQVELDKNLKPEDFKKIAEGFELDDGFVKPDDIAYDVDAGSKRVVGVTIHSGRNRIIRRIFEHLGYDVVKLDRVYYAGLTKKDVPRGRYRHLTEMEVNMLKMLKA